MPDATINFNGLDTTVHGPIRLGVLSALTLDGPLDFTTLRNRLQVSDGALGLHLGKLEAAGYITARKRFIARRPNTRYALTSAGRRAFDNYLTSMRRLLDQLANHAP